MTTRWCTASTQLPRLKPPFLRYSLRKRTHRWRQTPGRLHKTHGHKDVLRAPQRPSTVPSTFSEKGKAKASHSSATIAWAWTTQPVFVLRPMERDKASKGLNAQFAGAMATPRPLALRREEEIC